MKSAQSILFGGSHYDSPGVNWGLLLGRLGFGLLLFSLHGLGKFMPAENFVGGIAALGFPAPLFFAWASFAAEGVGSLLVAIGLFTRPAALLITINMAVAAFLKHSADGLDAREKALLFLIYGLVFLFAGAGRFSFDRLFNRSAA
jgi:putative oxidoreductase